MIIEYKNFKIKEDPYCFILEEYGPANPKKGKMEIVLKDTTYPSTLENAFILLKKKVSTSKEEKIELDNIIIELKTENNTFLKEIKELLNNK